MPQRDADTNHGATAATPTTKHDSPRTLPLIFIAGFTVNYLLMGLSRYGYMLPIPTSAHVELAYLVLIAYGAAHAQRWGTGASRAMGPMIGIYLAWTFFSTIQAVNLSSEIDFSTIITRWLAEYRTMTLQVFWAFMVNGLYFKRMEQVRALYRLWALLTIVAVAWGLRQQFGGFDRAEWAWLLAVGMKTHFVNGIIRYFSFFSEAANYGCCMGASTVVFGVLFLTTTSSKRDRMLFGLAAAAALYGMMASGARAAIFVLAAGLMAYCVISKRISTLIATMVVGGLFVGFLMLTDIGQGNAMIRRMRSAFNKEDNSLAVREINKATMKRYIDAMPFGLGAGIRNSDVPPSNKNHYLATVPPDSTWVYVDIHYGHLGQLLFLLSFGGMIAIGGMKVLFNIRDPELSGQMAAIVAGSFAMFVAGYANQIMLQFPNTWLFFGNLSLVALAEEMEQQRNADLAAAQGNAPHTAETAHHSIFPLESQSPLAYPLDNPPASQAPLDTQTPVAFPLDNLPADIFPLDHKA